MAELRAGGLPLWNPYLFLGVPFLANPQAAVLYPLHWPLSWLRPEQALDLVGAPPCMAGGRLHLHLCPAFAGPQPAGRVAGRADLRPGRIHAGSRREHQPAQRPGLAARAAMALRRDGARPRAGDRVSAGARRWRSRSRCNCWPVTRRRPLLTWSGWGYGRDGRFWLACGERGGGAEERRSGGAQETGSTETRTRGQGTDEQYGRRDYLLPLLAVIPAILLAAAQLLPTLELNGLGLRTGGLPYRQAVSFSLRPRLLAQSLLPPYGRGLDAAFGSEGYAEFVGYVGIAALVLAGIGLSLLWRRTAEAHAAAVERSARDAAGGIGVSARPRRVQPALLSAVARDPRLRPVPRAGTLAGAVCAGCGCARCVRVGRAGSTTETRGHGDAETRRQGNGDRETRKQGHRETGRQGNRETRKQGNKGTAGTRGWADASLRASRLEPAFTC